MVIMHSVFVFAIGGVDGRLSRVALTVLLAEMLQPCAWVVRLAVHAARLLTVRRFAVDRAIIPLCCGPVIIPRARAA